MTEIAERKPLGIPQANDENTTAISRIGEGEGIGKTKCEQSSIAAIVRMVTNRLPAILKTARRHGPVMVVIQRLRDVARRSFPDTARNSHNMDGAFRTTGKIYDPSSRRKLLENRRLRILRP